MVPSDKQVSLVLPLTVVGVCSVIQLLLGASPAIIAMCAIAIIVPFLPFVVYGRDLYSVLGVGFSLTYVGIALVTKTFYGQTLDSNLYDPYAAFGLTMLLMVVLTAMLATARYLDRGKSLFSFPIDLRSLRRLSLICIGLGLVGAIVVAGNKSTESGGSNAGAAIVLGKNFQDLFYLGLIAEVTYAIIKSDGRSFVSFRLGLWLLLETLMVVALNVREVLVSCIIGVVTAAFLHGMLRFRHLVIGMVGLFFLINVMTPITIYLRMSKEGLSITQFVVLAVDTVAKAATDPDFFRMISDSGDAAATQNDNVLVATDYYHKPANVLGRLSWVALVDAVYNGTRTRVPIGMAALDETLAATAPGFLGYRKSTQGMGDWLSWQTGLSEPGRVYYAIFGLPMEGLASWGLLGMIAYPFLFMLPVLYVCGTLSSFRLTLPLSIFLFTAIQHSMLESTSETFVAFLTRGVLFLVVIIFILSKMVSSGSRGTSPKTRAFEAPN
ncbi:hypothetical protein CU048_08775 [Beijerinckiaceae bacterium]|nr:hypothetical protein CU048_08775 [Beijerinckiaceae bacterium]